MRAARWSRDRARGPKAPDSRDARPRVAARSRSGLQLVNHREHVGRQALNSGEIHFHKRHSVNQFTGLCDCVWLSLGTNASLLK